MRLGHDFFTMTRSSSPSLRFGFFLVLLVSVWLLGGKIILGDELLTCNTLQVGGLA